MPIHSWILFGVLALPATTLAAPTDPAAAVPISRVADQATLQRQLHAAGYALKGGIAGTLTDGSDPSWKSFPHFTGSFSHRGQTESYTMVGYAPASGRTALLRALIIPLRLRFERYGGPVVFDPAPAIENILASPLFNVARFANGTGQFGDTLQRATFWNRMDSSRAWHVMFREPRVSQTIEVPVAADVGSLSIAPDGTVLGSVADGALDAVMETLIEVIRPAPDELPIFVTYNASEQFALGYHTAYPVTRDGVKVLQTFIFASWYDLAPVGPDFADVSTLNHEMGEWLNDPYANNRVQSWTFPGIAACGGFYLEVGDPEGNGPNYASFPTVVVPLNGYNYHLQDLVMLPWFADEVPSSAFGGWYDFPATTYITTPSARCERQGT